MGMQCNVKSHQHADPNQSEGIRGDLLEIGVYRGKSAALSLLHTDRENETLVLVDLNFRKRRIKRILRRFGREDWRGIEAHRCDSRKLLQLPEFEVRDQSFRWIHIDGEHTSEALRSDLESAHRLLSCSGILCIDDFFSTQYPQLTKTLFDYLKENPDRFQLFLTGFSKAFLARPEAAGTYLRFCRDELIVQIEKRGIRLTLFETDSCMESGFGIGHREGQLQYRGHDNPSVTFDPPSPSSIDLKLLTRSDRVRE